MAFLQGCGNAGVECKMAQPLWRTGWHCLPELTFTTMDPIIVLPRYSPNDLETYVLTQTCTQMITVALFIVAKNWKQ